MENYFKKLINELANTALIGHLNVTKNFKCPYVTVKAYSQVREYPKCPSRKRFDQYLSFRGTM